MSHNVFTLNAELFARVCRLIVGVKHWVYQLHTIPLGYFLVVRTSNQQEIASFYVEDMHFNKSPLCVTVPSDLIEMMAHALLKDCKGDLILDVKSNGNVGFNINDTELAILTSDNNRIIVNNLTAIVDSAEAEWFSNFIAHTSRWSDSIYLDKIGALALEPTNSFLSMIPMELEPSTCYQITAPKFLYAMVNRLKLDESVLSIDSKEDNHYLSFHSEVKLSSKDLVRLVVSYKLTSTEFETPYLHNLINATLNGRKLNLTEDYINYTKNYIKTSKLKPNEVVQLTEHFALTSKFFSVMFGSGDSHTSALRIHKDMLSVVNSPFMYLAKLSHKPSYKY